MLPGGCLWLMPLWLLVEASPPDPLAGAGGSHDHPGGVAHDHEAFLGPEEAKTFDQLPPEESQRRLGLLVGLIDADSDGGVSVSELGAWIQRRHQRSRDESLAQGLRLHDRDGDGRVGWDEYRSQLYGDPEEDFGDTPHPEKYRGLLARDWRRFQAADRDGDGAATPQEFAAFLHPEDFEHMRGIVVQETIEDMDRDGDGFIQEDEYIADLYEGLPGAPEPPWVQLERSQFRTGRDRDGDGRLGPEEVGGWLRPPRSDWAAAEAEHLVLRADGDQDGQLSRGEIMGHWQLFVGSQATSYGEDLQRPHDEL